MCGRFVQLCDPESYAEAFEVEALPLCPPRYNLAPSQPLLAIRRGTGAGREAVLLRWGLVPGWSKGPDPHFSMINARAETVHLKPAYRSALRRRRCLIPAEGFYEWKALSTSRQPYFIAPEAPGPFAMAGLWERWNDPGGTPLESCTLIVTAASPQLLALHERMPVILPRVCHDTWLDPQIQDPRVLLSLLQPYSGPMRFYPVSRRVNTPRDDDASLIEPLAPR